ESLNLYDVLRCRSLNFVNAGRHAPRELVDRLRVRRVFALNHDWLTRVTRLTNIWIKFDVAEEGHAKLARGLFRSTLRKDVDFVIAVRADEVAHVLHHAYDVDLHLPEHLDGFACILQRNV